MREKGSKAAQRKISRERARVCVTIDRDKLETTTSKFCPKYKSNPANFIEKELISENKCFISCKLLSFGLGFRPSLYVPRGRRLNGSKAAFGSWVGFLVYSRPRGKFGARPCVSNASLLRECRRQRRRITTSRVGGVAQPSLYPKTTFWHGFSEKQALTPHPISIPFRHRDRPNKPSHGVPPTGSTTAATTTGRRGASSSDRSDFLNFIGT